MSFTGCNKAKDVLNTRVGRGPEAPEARGARNRRGVPRREAPHKSPRRQIWNSLLVQWLEQSVLRRAFNFLSIFFLSRDEEIDNANSEQPLSD